MGSFLNFPSLKNYTFRQFFEFPKIQDWHRWAVASGSQDSNSRPLGSCLSLPRPVSKTAGSCLNFPRLKTDTVGWLFELTMTKVLGRGLNRPRSQVLGSCLNIPRPRVLGSWLSFTRTKVLGIFLNFLRPQVLGSSFRFPRPKVLSSILNFSTPECKTAEQLFEFPMIQERHFWAVV